MTYIDNKDKSRLDRIEEKLDILASGDVKIKKQKEFKLPWKAKVNKKRARANYVTIMKINENRHVIFTKEPIIEQTVVVDGIPRIASGEHILTYKKNPMIILPSWSVNPFSPPTHYQESLKDGSNSVGYRLMMNRMKLEAIKLGKKIGGLGLTIGGIVIAIIIVYALWKG